VGLASPSSAQSGAIKLLRKYRWVLIAALPLALSALFALVVLALSPFRYRPSYFSQVYVERYPQPGSTALALDQALRTANRELLAELEGLRRTVPLATSPTLNLTVLLETDSRYHYYLYFDTKTYDRHTYAIEKVKGRWAVAPPDAHFYLCSGRWLRVAGPVAVLWWFLEVTVLLMRWIFRASARYREGMYGGR
jgi:hypothetical protein